MRIDRPPLQNCTLEGEWGVTPNSAISVQKQPAALEHADENDDDAVPMRQAC